MTWIGINEVPKSFLELCRLLREGYLSENINYFYIDHTHENLLNLKIFIFATFMGRKFQHGEKML